MAWSPLDIIDAIDASPTIQRAKERQGIEALPPAREIGTGAKGGGSSFGSTIFIGMVAVFLIVTALVVVIMAVTGGS